MSPYKIYYHGDLGVRIEDGVYEPAEDSLMLLEAAVEYRTRRALEIGTGCGLTAISLSRAGCPFVVGTDISIEAIKCAAANVSIYSPGVHLIRCDLFGPVDIPFELVLFNPPYVPVENANGEEAYWAGGKGGRELIDRFIGGLGQRLSEDGRALLVHSSLNDLDLTRSIAGKQGFDLEVINTRPFFFEKLYVVELVRQPA
ncbi:MAG: methyltransferase [Theionarchaea archaeon]|nr:methyltransferase [Theionarchaea archaeon]